MSWSKGGIYEKMKQKDSMEKVKPRQASSFLEPTTSSFSRRHSFDTTSSYHSQSRNGSGSKDRGKLKNASFTVTTPASSDIMTTTGSTISKKMISEHIQSQVVEAMAEQETMTEKHRAELAQLEDKWKGQVADAMAEQESAIAEAVTELELSQERHREELVVMEAKWKTKVKTVLLIANDKVTAAEQKLQNQVEESEGLASSNSRLKEIAENMAENQAVLREKHDTKEELRTIGKELVRLRKQLKRQELLMAEMLQNYENLRKEMMRMSTDKEEVWWQELREATGKVERLEREVKGRRREVEEYQEKVGTMEADRDRGEHQALVLESALSVVAVSLALGCWVLRRGL